jgi:competence protein ComEC
VRYPALPPAIAILCGAAIGVRCAAPAEAVAAVLVLGAALSIVSWRERVAPAFVASALLTAAASGYSVSSVAAHRALHAPLRAVLAESAGPQAVSDVPGDTVTLVGVLQADAAAAVSGVRLSLDVRHVRIDRRERPARGGVLLTVTGAAPPGLVEQWRGGRTLSLPAQLRRPSRYLNPGARDEEAALAFRGTTLVGSVKSALLVQVVEPGPVHAEAAACLRWRVRRTVDRLVGAHDARSAAIVRAILLGDRAGLDDETEERLRDAGTYHVIAISGGNIAVLASAMLLGAGIAGLRPGIAHPAAAAMLAGYAFLVGGGASVVRATLMADLYLLARAVDHRAKPLNAVGASAGLTCAIDPLAVCDAGAWLTYGATVSILAGAPPLLARLRSAPLAIRVPAGLLAASVSAELGLFPVSALAFSRVTAAGLVLNFAAVPLMSAVQAGGILLLAADVLVPGAAPAVARVTHVAAWSLVESARGVELAPWSVVRVPAPCAGVVAAYYAAWLAWFALLRLAAASPAARRAARLARGAAGLALVVCGAWIVFTPHLRFARTDALEAAFIDVGQGTSTLVRFPSGDALLVDAGGGGGGRFDIGRRVVAPAIWAAGVRRLTHLVVTHADADHVGGAAVLVADFRPREVWEGVPVPPEPLLQHLRSAAARAGAAWRTVQRGDRIRFGDAEVVAYHPPRPEWERQRVRNDDSVVVEVRFGDVSLLLTGDVERAAEAELARLVEPAGVRVMLAPHHGSATSSTRPLIDAAAPALAVVSAGRGNRYGHPHAAALDRYRAAGARVLRTDLDGAIALRTDGRTVEVRTFSGLSLTLRPMRRAPRLRPA